MVLDEKGRWRVLASLHDSELLFDSRLRIHFGQSANIIPIQLMHIEAQYRKLITMSAYINHGIIKDHVKSWWRINQISCIQWYGNCI